MINNNNPIALTAATVIFGDARFTVLTQHLIRMEWCKQSLFEDHASLVFINRKLPVPLFSKEIIDKTLIIATKYLKLSYTIEDGPFTEKNLKIEFILNDSNRTWHPGLKDNKNLKGTARTLDECNGGFHKNGKALDLGMGIISRSGWSLIDDSQTHIFDESGWVKERPDHKKLDWYFFGHGHNYKQALYDYTLVAGKIPIPPKYAFGYWWSRYWVYSDFELRELINEIRGFNIPIDVLIIDMDWHTTEGLTSPKKAILDPFGESVGWTGYTWNKNLFPNPEKFLKWAKSNHLKTSLNLHPASGIPPTEEKYEEFAAKINFDSSKKDYIPYQMAVKKWAEVFFNSIIGPIEKQGIDFWWLDWQQFPTSRIVKNLNNTWWLNHIFFTDMENRRKTRPMLFHRWGGLGNHRYQIGFSGDDAISWASLKYQTYFTATASNVCYGYWSHDIGGHYDSKEALNPELYYRWIQFGVFSPILRTHSSKISHIERRFWKFPDHFSIIRKIVHLRYSLAPYIYNAAKHAYDSGISICRPMYYENPEKEEAYVFNNQYMFGDSMLVSPITKPLNINNKLASQSTWLPPGEWYDWFKGKFYSGDCTIEAYYSINEIPLFVKAGSIIPMYPEVPNLQAPISKQIFTIVPGGDNSLELYEDNGNDIDYKSGEYSITKVESIRMKTRHHIIIHPRTGNFKGSLNKKSCEIHLPCTFPPQKVILNGGEICMEEETSDNSFSYFGDGLETRINISERSVSQKLEIEIIYKDAELKMNTHLDGKVGIFRRLRGAIKGLKNEVARKNQWATMPNEILVAEQTVTQINYHPENLAHYILEFDDQLKHGINAISKMKEGRKEELKKYINFLSS